MPKDKFDSKRERFKVLAERRTNNILNAIRILSHCSNRSLYEYQKDEVDRIFRAIDESLSDARSKFRERKKNRFTL